MFCVSIKDNNGKTTATHGPFETKEDAETYLKKLQDFLTQVDLHGQVNKMIFVDGL